MADSASAFNSGSYLASHKPSSRKSPHYVEIRDYRVSKDQLPKMYRKPHAMPSYSISSKAAYASSDYSSAYATRTKPRASNNPNFVWKSSRLHKGSLEYEDIYNQRVHRERRRGRVSYGGYSFREERHRRRHMGIDDTLSDTKDLPGVRHGDIVRTVSMRETDERGMEDINHSRKIKTFRDIRDIEERGKVINVQNRKVTRDNSEEPSIQEQIRRARQTSFLRNKEHEAVDERSATSSAVNEVIVNVNNLNVDGSSRPTHITSSRDFQANSPRTKPKQPPPVAPKPVRPNPQTTRSASPAPSIISSVSDIGSQATQKSATSEVSVKSILKKPRRGRVVLKEEPSAFTILAVLSCIFCFPFGIYALNKSNQVKIAVEENNYDAALSSSKKVKNFCIGVTIAYVGIFAIGGAFLAKYLITGELF